MVLNLNLNSLRYTLLVKRQIDNPSPGAVTGAVTGGNWSLVLTRESDTEIPSKGTSPFTPMGEITVDPKGVLKLLNNLNIHKASGPDGLSARVLKECSSEISPMLALTWVRMRTEWLSCFSQENILDFFNNFRLSH